MLYKVFWMALAGALGTLARYGLGDLVHRFAGNGLPWGTLVVNAVGCLLAGVCWTLFEGRLPVSAEMRLIILVGFMGAFTTFSAFVAETGALLHSDAWMRATGNILMQNVLGVTAFLLGVSLGRIG